MDIPFGPQLIGQTEKALNAILRRVLHGTGLDEPRWVTLRLAGALDDTVDAAGLAAAVAERAHLLDAPALVEDLTRRGLLAHGQLTPDGLDLTSTVQAAIATVTAPIWADLPADDVAAASRVLDQVSARAQAILR